MFVDDDENIGGKHGASKQTNTQQAFVFVVVFS